MGHVTTGNLKITPDSRIRNNVLSINFLPISCSIDEGKNLHLHKVILLIDGVHEKVFKCNSLKEWKQLKYFQSLLRNALCIRM